MGKYSYQQIRKIIDVMNQEFRENGRSAKFVEAMNSVIKTGDGELNYEVARMVSGVDVSAHARVVLASGDARVNYMFGMCVKKPEVDVRAHGRVVIERGDENLNYLYAKVPGADVLAHGRVVLNSNSVQFNYLFGSYVPGANVKEHYQKLKSLDKPDVFYAFYRKKKLFLVKKEDLEK